MDGKTLAAIILFIPALVFKSLKYFVTHRILLIVLVVVVGFFVIKGNFFKNDEYPQEVPEYQRIMPSEQNAPRIVQTTSRYYPYSTFKEDSNFLILTDYYIYDREGWRHETKPLRIERERIVQIFTR